MKLGLAIPTYNEKENLPELIEKIANELRKNKIRGDVIIVDDNSPDGTGELAEKLRKKYRFLKVVHRKGKLGLSSAVLEGWKASDAEILGAMDADLSHPVSKIHELFETIENSDADFAIGSRYTKGGKIENWTSKRKLMSRGATMLARPYTRVKDPMSGFFMIKKECIKRGKINPKGFKILLELIIKADYRKIKEIPITFTDRTKGKSKAGTKEIFYYLQNLIGYLPYKKTAFGEFVKFAVVGGTGTLINLGILYLLTTVAGIYYMLSAIFSFLVAMTSNFFLNKIWTFKENIKSDVGKKYVKFGTISIIALGVNLTFLYIFTEIAGIYYLISQALAIGIALIINFLGNKAWTFKK